MVSLRACILVDTLVGAVAGADAVRAGGLDEREGRAALGRSLGVEDDAAERLAGRAGDAGSSLMASSSGLLPRDFMRVVLTILIALEVGLYSTLELRSHVW